MDKDILKKVYWIGTSYEDWKSFPNEVQDEMGYALYQAQIGQKAFSAKPLKGFKGANVLEICERHDGDAWRAVYTVQFKGVIYVLHAFQKKSKSGIKTPISDIKLINERLKQAKIHYETIKA